MESELLSLTPGLSFRVEISFHDLMRRHPDSQFGVGVGLYSNYTLAPTADFSTQSILLPTTLLETQHRVSKISISCSLRLFKLHQQAALKTCCDEDLTGGKTVMQLHCCL